MASAVQAVRAAPHNDKETALSKLRSLSCQHPPVCETQEVCVQAYRLHQQALETASLVRQSLRNDVQMDASKAAEVLALSEKDLERAKVLIDECLQLETALVVEARP